MIEKQSGELFYDKLGFKFLEIANFAKTGDQLETNMDKWLYLLKHMGDLDRIPYFKEEQTHYEDRFMIEWNKDWNKAKH